MPFPTPAPGALCTGSPGASRDELEGKEPQKGAQQRLDRWLEGVAKAVGGRLLYSGIISAAKQAVRINQRTMHDLGPHPLPSFGGDWRSFHKSIQSALQWAQCIGQGPS